MLEFLRTKSKLKKCKDKDTCDFIFGGYLFKGELKDNKNTIYSQYT